MSARVSTGTSPPRRPAPAGPPPPPGARPPPGRPPRARGRPPAAARGARARAAGGRPRPVGPGITTGLVLAGIVVPAVVAGAAFPSPFLDDRGAPPGLVAGEAPAGPLPAVSPVPGR